jgi:hypothetical protein
MTTLHLVTIPSTLASLSLTPFPLRSPTLAYSTQEGYFKQQHAHTHTHTHTHSHTHTHTHTHTRKHTHTHTRARAHTYLHTYIHAGNIVTGNVSLRYVSVAFNQVLLAMAHCCYTVSTILLRCKTVVKVSLQCCYTVDTLLLQSCYTCQRLSTDLPNRSQPC